MGRETLETDDLLMSAVLYEWNGREDDSSILVKSPVEIPCRWIDVIRDPKQPMNESLVYDVRLYTDRVITDESILWKGKLIRLPETPTDLYQSVGHDETPDLQGAKFRYCSYLIRYGGTLPTIEN